MARPFGFGTLSFIKRGQTESDKCGCIHRVTDLFGLLIAPPSHLTESQNRCYLVKRTFRDATAPLDQDNFNKK